MALFPEIEGLDLKKLMTLFAGPPLDGDEFGAVYYQELAAAIRKYGAEGVTFLIGALGHADENRLRGVFLGLTITPLLEPDVGDLIASYLADDRAPRCSGCDSRTFEPGQYGSDGASAGSNRTSIRLRARCSAGLRL
jgi:hypothetical protein